MYAIRSYYGIGRGFHDGQVAGQFQFANLVLGEEAEFTLLLAIHHAVQVGDTQYLAHVTAVRLAGADRSYNFV